MSRLMRRFKKGAASFYIVAFSTLILVIIAASFAAIVISEVTRTTNDDLSQSAYDSALAGIEDGKLAFYNYQKCLGATATAPNGDGIISCGEIVYWVENPDCDMVAHIIGRIGELEEGAVVVQESNVASNNMSQSYTCVKIDTILSDYRSTLSKNNQSKMIKVNLDGVSASQIKAVRLSWYSDTNGSVYEYTNFNSTSGRVEFPSLVTNRAATPPTVALTLIQTAQEFDFGSFDMTIGDQTNRGTIYMVPIRDSVQAGKTVEDNYVGVYNASRTSDKNYVQKKWILKSNDKVRNNLPLGVYCPQDSGDEFACSAYIELPEPINGNRNDDTFLFVVSLPYGKPSTDFALEFLCADGAVCATNTIISDEGEEIEVETNQVNLKGTQISIDSTGRANDLFRRVESRLDSEMAGEGFSFAQYAINLTGGGDNDLDKNIIVTKEWDFGD